MHDISLNSWHALEYQHRSYMHIFNLIPKIFSCTFAVFEIKKRSNIQAQLQLTFGHVPKCDVFSSWMGFVVNLCMKCYENCDSVSLYSLAYTRLTFDLLLKCRKFVCLFFYLFSILFLCCAGTRQWYNFNAKLFSENQTDENL